MKDLVAHRLAKNPRWAPGVVAVAASFSAFLLIAIARHAANSPSASPDDSDDNRSGSRMHNAMSTPDSEPDDDHDARDDEVDNGDAAAETLGEGEGEGRNREEIDDEEEYVVLTDAEVCMMSAVLFAVCAPHTQGSTHQVPGKYERARMLSALVRVVMQPSGRPPLLREKGSTCVTGLPWLYCLSHEDSRNSCRYASSNVNNDSPQAAPPLKTSKQQPA